MVIWLIQPEEGLHHCGGSSLWQSKSPCGRQGGGPVMTGFLLPLYPPDVDGAAHTEGS